MLYPEMFGEELGSHCNNTLCDGGAVPVPVRDCTVGEFDALLVDVKVALTVVYEVGVNVTVKLA